MRSIVCISRKNAIPGAGLLVLVVLVLYGCGTAEESTEQWEVPTTGGVVTSNLEYRIDSLSNENRRLKQQLEAITTENRKLVARAAELETKLTEAPLVPVPQTAPPTAPKTSAVRTPSNAPPASTGAANAGYEEALATYRRGDYVEAEKQFEELLSRGVSADLVGNCHYWIGQSFYDRKKYKEAIPHFQTVIDLTVSKKKPDAYLMLGNCHFSLGNSAAAKDAYTRLITAYPTSPYVKKAKDRLARIK
jgi:tol-pal system protein YbgF